MRYHLRLENGTVERVPRYFNIVALNGDIVRKTVSLLALIAASAMPAAALAGNTVDASLIPDGTYTAVVEKVVDDKHVLVKMNNGMETTLTTDRPNVDFTKAKTNDNIKLSLIKGLVAVYAVQH